MSTLIVSRLHRIEGLITRWKRLLHCNKKSFEVESIYLGAINFHVAIKGSTRVESVIESSLLGAKNFALINLNLNFCETTIYEKVFLEQFSCSVLTLYEIIKDFLKFCSCCVLGE